MTTHIRARMPRKGGNSFYRDKTDYTRFCVTLCGASVTDRDVDYATANTKKFRAGGLPRQAGHSAGGGDRRVTKRAIAMTPDRLLGRRYTFTAPQFAGGYMVRRAHDVTLVAWDPQRGYQVHADDGSRAWFAEAALGQLFEAGALAESAQGPVAWRRA